jgi:hypothetical protein
MGHIMLPINKEQVTYLRKIEMRARYFTKALKDSGLRADFSDVVGILSEATVRGEKKYAEDAVHEAKLDTYVSTCQRNAIAGYRKELEVEMNFADAVDSVAPDATFLIYSMNEAYSLENEVDKQIWQQISSPCSAVQDVAASLKPDNRYSRHMRSVAQYCDVDVRRVVDTKLKILKILEESCE